jgi:glycosyltransferase involved in cell wall biosynthesis
MRLWSSEQELVSEPSRRRRLALILWNGNVGGAETLSVSLAERLRQLGAEVTIVFVEQPLPLAERLRSARVPYRSLGFGRGRDVLRYPRRYAAEAARSGPDGALLVERGFMGAALRLGGYRGPVVAVEHGSLLELPNLSIPQGLLQRINYLSGAWADNAEVAVSDFMLDRTCRHPHARQIQRIYNGIDPDMYLPGARPATDEGNGLVVGFAGRLIPGKGADHLIRAVAQTGRQRAVKLLIAGDGPERTRLTSLARTLGADSKVDFLGVIDDLPAFWRRCDVATMPSDTFVESFSMVTLEAMTCGKPIVASRNGAVSELMIDGVTGTLVDPGNVDALTRALVDYAEQPALRRAHGEAARTRAIERFHIDACAQAYLDLFGGLARSRPWRPWPWPSGGRRWR